MLTTTDITRVLAEYDLGTLQSTTAPRRGNVNETSFIKTTKGQFVLRRNHRSQSELSQRYRHRLLSRLYEQGFPVPALLPTRNGDTLLSLDGRRYEVTTFIEGDSYHADCSDHQYSVGLTLAQYHSLVQTFPAPPTTAQRRYQPSDVLRMGEAAMERDMMGELSALLAWYDTRASLLRHEWPLHVETAFPRLVIHGDIHRDNILFGQDRVVGLLDYDQVSWDSRLVDLVDALVAFASVDKPSVAGWGVFPGPLHKGRAERLLAGYTSVAPLSAAEVKMLLSMLEILWLEGELARVMITPEGSPDYHMAVLEQGYELSQWLDMNRPQLFEQWLNTSKRKVLRAA